MKNAQATTDLLLALLEREPDHQVLFDADELDKIHAAHAGKAAVSVHGFTAGDGTKKVSVRLLNQNQLAEEEKRHPEAARESAAVEEGMNEIAQLDLARELFSFLASKGAFGGEESGENEDGDKRPGLDPSLN